MLKITHPITKTNTTQPASEQAKPAPAKLSVKPMRSMEELMIIKERVEEETQGRKQRERQAMAEMFLAGPLAWPDYPESEDLEFSDDEWEEWIPLDCDQDFQFRAPSSDGQ